MKKIIFSVLFLPSIACSQVLKYTPDSQATGRTLSPSSVSASTVNVNQNSTGPNAYTDAPITFNCNANAFCQLAGQNQSNGTAATGELVVTNDLGGNTSYYITIGINSSLYSQAPFSVEPSSAGFMYTSDSPMIIGAGSNGTVNGGKYGSQNSPYIVFVTSTPTPANINLWISTTGIVVPANSTFTIMGNSFSIGGSTLSVSNGKTGLGTRTPQALLDLVGVGSASPVDGLGLPSDSLAVIAATTPARAGIVFYCNNCATSSSCISTGTATGQVSDITARTTQCK